MLSTMKYSLLILSSPQAGQSSDSAWRFADALVSTGHELYRVFFYHEGVYHGNELAVAPQGAVDPLQRWADLAERSGAELVLCIASAVKRGVLEKSEAKRHEKSAANMHPAFIVSGLGQLVDASACCDRLVTFGN
jgi:tRNA 2-thiouridine synthesizing protein D